MDYSAEKYKLKIKELSKEEKDKLIDELTDNIEKQDKIIYKEPYTEIEKEVADNLVKAWNSFCKLERQHPDEIRYFCDGIHKCQSVLGMRILRRDYPNIYPIKK